MSYLTIILDGGPLNGFGVPMKGSIANYGYILELPYTEVVSAKAVSDYSYVAAPIRWETVTRTERTAIYKCQGGADSTSATFVGVLR